MSAVEGATRYRRRGQVSLPNEAVYDDSITYHALGLLAILLARPDEAPSGYRALVRPKVHVAQASLLAGLRELTAAGYRRQFLRTVTNARGRNTVVTDTYISDTPLPDAEFRNWHRDATGQEPVDMPDRRKPKTEEPASKDTLASARGAHERGAHERGAHEDSAQTKAFPGSSKLSKLNQEGADAPRADQAPPTPKRTADADRPNGSSRRDQTDAADASSVERIHCLGCDHTFYRDELNIIGQCPKCAAAFKAARDQEAAASLPAPDPAQIAALAAEAKQASLERQAKRLGITVAQLVAKRQARA